MAPTSYTTSRDLTNVGPTRSTRGKTDVRPPGPAQDIAKHITPALTGTAAGRAALFSQVYARPWRLSPDDARAAVDAFLDGPAFEPVLEASGHYRFGAADELRGVPVTIALGHARRAAHPPAGHAGAAAAAVGPARRAARVRPRALSRRPEAVAAVLLAGSREG